MREINSLWQATAMARAPSARLEADQTCDVAIIGGGFTGLRAALELAERGCDAVVLEAQDVGFGASGRSGGQVNPMLPVYEPKDLQQAVGPTYFERMAEISLASADALFELVRKHDIDCDARQNGWVRADHSASARDRARKAAKLWNKHGAGFEFLDGAEIACLTGSQAYASATLSRRGGAVQPLSLVRGLAAAAESKGARIYANAPVSHFQREGGTWVLQAAGHSVRADALIVATNGYTDGLVPGLKKSVLPLFSIQIATGPLGADQIGPVLPEGHTISDTRRLIMYARREPGRQAVFGGIGYRTPTGGIGGFRWLLADAPRVFASLAGVDWSYRWGGAIALTPDRVPHLHEPEPGLIAGLGYNGRGVAMSLVMGKVLADRAMGTELSALPFPVSPIRGYAFRQPQIVGAGLAMHWMRLQDRREIRQGQ